MSIMKKYIYAFGVVAAMLLSSCSDFLDVQPEGNVTTEKSLTNDQQCIDAIDGLYYVLVGGDNFYGREFFYEQAGANDMVWGRNRGFNTLALNTFTGDESPLRNDFEDIYTVIHRANEIIQVLAKRDQSQLTDIMQRSLGEAYFVRGWMHFLSAYHYGTDKHGVPFVAYETIDGGYNYTIPDQSATVMDDYQSICDDMDKAENLLPKFETYDTDDQGRPHAAAALALKAKAYAYWATWDATQWTNVITCVNKLESTYGRALTSDYNTLFSDQFSDFWNAEYIWSLKSSGGTNGGGTCIPGIVLENKGWGKYNGWGYFKPTQDLYEELAKDDDDLVDASTGNVRLKRTMLCYGDEFQFWGETRRFYSTSDLEAGFMINKYTEPFKYANADETGHVNTNGDYPTADCNFHIIRFADVLLLRAEAYLMTGQADKATTDINRLRNRANLKSLSGTATTADLYHERRCELAFEGNDHLFDCKRWAIGSDQTLKNLALNELNNDPKVRHYTDRSNPDSDYTIGAYQGYSGRQAFKDYMVVFPYPSDAITESNGRLVQNDGY